ncbi:MAG: hypothetical protein E7563_01785 [Ruminococcaceae bacterium]|nr:hypothetical protein [Oscillospiraceae bacterium]
MNTFRNTYGKRLLLVFMVVVTAFALFGCGNNKITSVEEARLSYSSYHSGGTVYEFVPEGDKIRICCYEDVYTEDGFVQELKKSALVDTEKFIEHMNYCKVYRWDGFSGNAWGVMDGTSFTFTATVNEGDSIYAHGYMKFPKDYHEFLRGVNDMLDEAEETT